jgi:hypothetical protein
MKIADYVKIEQMKNLLTRHLLQMRMFEQVQTINDRDLDMLISLMAQLFDELRGKETDDERMEFMVEYIIGLWGRLIIDYGANMDEL